MSTTTTRSERTAARASSTSGTREGRERWESLQALAARNPAAAKARAFEWLRELDAPRHRDTLGFLFAQGTAPESPDGDCEGIVMYLEGATWLVGLDKAVRLGQWLGGIGWTGKSFDGARGTGFNRLTATSWPIALLVMPTYRFERRGSEILGFHFHHAIEASPVAPHGEVRSIRYDSPEHANPLVLPRTRDELVELVPGVYLGRALLRTEGRFETVGYFGLRHPSRGGR